MADGRGEDEPPATGVEVRWAGSGRDAADDLIVELLPAVHGPAAVVTADRRLRPGRQARDAEVLGPRTFRARLDAADEGR